MTIRDSRIVLDTNVWIYGLRQDQDYRGLGCRRGDAAVAALTEHVGAEVLVTENREFLRDVPNLPFRLVTSSALLAELDRS